MRRDEDLTLSAEINKNLHIPMIILTEGKKMLIREIIIDRWTIVDISSEM